jgi:hypothetical protein
LLVTTIKGVDAERVLRDIADALPHDNPKKILETMIVWGRYEGIMDHNPNSKTVFVPDDEENTTRLTALASADRARVARPPHLG